MTDIDMRKHRHICQICVKKKKDCTCDLSDYD